MSVHDQDSPQSWNGPISWIIDGSVRHRTFVVVALLLLVIVGILGVRGLPLDAIPDLSDVQVIVYTDYPGQSPDVVEDQVTYPLTTQMLAVPGARSVRGYSFFGFSLVYAIFDDGTDLYWARARTLEALSSAEERLPAGVRPRLGPDATGVGWVYQYALLDFGFYAERLRARYDLDHDGRVDAEEANRTLGRAELASDLGSEIIGAAEATDFALSSFDQDGDQHLRGIELVRAANFPGVGLDELRSLQDWFLRYELASLPGVAEVASVGGFVRQYQVEIDPDKLNAYGISLAQVTNAIRRSNGAVGGRLVEMAETEYMVRGLGYVASIDDLERTVLTTDAERHVPILLRDVAHVALGPELRRGVTDLNGFGDTASGIVVMRFGENALGVIEGVQKRLEQLKASLPTGVTVVPVYDRSTLIRDAVATLQARLTEEMLIVALICTLFLLHLRSALVAIFVVPMGVLMALLLMRLIGITANVMSLAGIAVAIGVMVDASVVMVENLHKHMERHPNRSHARRVIDSATEVGPAIFFSLVIITVSFLPVFGLQAQEGRLFQPLAFTKTFAMASASVLAITAIPVGMFYLVRGSIRPEGSNPLLQLCMRLYGPLLDYSLRHRHVVVIGAISVTAFTLVPYSQLGEEFMPPLEEGDLLYMPTTLPGISITEAKQVLQQTDAIISQFPEVRRVFGKVGRAETATDPAPLSMIETVIMLHRDRSHWRTKPVQRWYSRWVPEALKGPFRWLWPEEVRWSMPDLVRALDQAVRFPGLTNAWTMPIKTRLDMLATGIKTPVGIKLLGDDLQELAAVATEIETVLRELPGTSSVLAERVTGGRYVDFEVDRRQAARYGLNVGDVHDVIQSAIGGMNVSTTVEGLERYPINVRYSRELRDDLTALPRVLVPTPMGHSVRLGELAQIAVRDGPPMIKSENSRRTAWIFIDIDTPDLGGYVRRARAAIREQVQLPGRVSLRWSGQLEYLQRASSRLNMLRLITLVLVFALLYLHFRRLIPTLLVICTLPFAVVGAVWLQWALGYQQSVATAVGFIAVAGLAAETGVVMILYIDRAIEQQRAAGELRSAADLLAAIREGAVGRLRPKLMTVSTTLLGLLPILIADGTGAQAMRRIAAPMIGGLVTSTLLTLVLVPVVYYLILEWSQRRDFNRFEQSERRASTPRR